MMYRSQCEAIRSLPPEQFKAVVCALWDYEMDGIIPEGDPVVIAMFGMAKPLIDRRNAHYESGKKGGRPKTEKPNKNQNKPSDNQNKPTENQSEPNETVKDKEERKKEKGEKIKDIGERIKEKEKENIIATIIDHLNQTAGTAYRASSRDTKGHINARISEGYTVADFFTVIDKKTAEWKGTDMEKYLRPATLFGSKFEGYLNQKTTKKDRYSDVDDWVRGAL